MKELLIFEKRYSYITYNHNTFEQINKLYSNCIRE